MIIAEQHQHFNSDNNCLEFTRSLFNGQIETDNAKCTEVRSVINYLQGIMRLPADYLKRAVPLDPCSEPRPATLAMSLRNPLAAQYVVEFLRLGNGATLSKLADVLELEAVPSHLVRALFQTLLWHKALCVGPYGNVVLEAARRGTGIDNVDTYDPEHAGLTFVEMFEYDTYRIMGANPAQARRAIKQPNRGMHGQEGGCAIVFMCLILLLVTSFLQLL